MTPNPKQDSQLWSTCWLAGKQLPGVAKVTGNVGVDIDVQKSKGQDGAIFKDNGMAPADLQLTVLFTEKDLPELERICEMVNPRKIGGKRKPIEIKHARTDFLKIHSVYVKQISTPDLDDHMVGSITIDLIEWIPAPKKVKTVPIKTPSRDDSGVLVPDLGSLTRNQINQDVIQRGHSAADDAWVTSLESNMD